MIDTCGAKIIALTETWLPAHVLDSEIFHDAHQFTIYRCDRTERRGGGVLLAVSKDIPSSPIEINSALEITWVILTLGNSKLILGTCYRPPSSPPTFINELHDTINIVSSRFPSQPLFLLGDFNYPNIMWNTLPLRLSPFSQQADDFLNLCSVFSLAQLVTQATRVSNNVANTLDLVLTTHADLASHITYLPGISDHLSLNFIINAPIPNKSKHRKTIRDYRKANFVAINNELSHFYDYFVKHLDDRSVQSNWDLFASTVHRLTEKYIPNRTIISNAQAPWYSSNLKRLSNRKKRFYHLAKSSPSDARWAAYKSASDIYIAALKTAKDNYLSSTLPEILKTNLKSSGKQ